MRRRYMSVLNKSDNTIDINKYMTIEALEDELTVYFSNSGLQYCIDASGDWLELDKNVDTIVINKGQMLSFKGELYPNSTNGIGTFTISKKCNLLGNCTSLLFGDMADSHNSLSGYNYAFYKLFYNCKNIISASKNFLPSTSLSVRCYYYMFRGCTSLTTAPDLPAMTLSTYCYYCMFYGCSSLTTAPKLPATTLTIYCYYNMFYGCTSLTTAPDLLAANLVISCYSYMFSGCKKLNYIKMKAINVSASNCLYSWVNNVSPTGTFIKAAGTNITQNSSSGTPAGWDVIEE